LSLAFGAMRVATTGIRFGCSQKIRVKDFRSYETGDNLVCVLSGEHDLSTAAELREAVSSALGSQPRIVFDLSTARYIDSTILTMLVNQKQLLADRMRVVAPAGGLVRRVLEVSGLIEFLGTEPTLSSALLNDEPELASGD
jgi:anti-anti-sigma factor